MSFLKGFFIFSIFCIGLIGYTEGGLTFTVIGTGTSFSFTNYCRPTGISSNNSIAGFTQVSIKLGDSTINNTGGYNNTTSCSNMYGNCYSSTSNYCLHSNRNYGTYSFYLNSHPEYKSAYCIITGDPIIINYNSGTIDNYGNNIIKCNIEFNDNGPHTITIEDPLYNSEFSINSGQITGINIGLEGEYKYQTRDETGYSFNSGNVNRIVSLYGLPKLKTLDLSNNKITSTQFLRDKYDVNNLERLNLSNNNISSIYEGNIGNNSNLKELNLSSNMLTEINSNTFQSSSFDSLEYLDLSKNKISSIGANSFAKMGSGLQVLRLDNQNSNSLDIAQKSFGGLNKLTSLYLENNRIKKLEGQTFYGLTHIQNLNLENNRIETIKSDNSSRDPFDEFATDSSGEILINLSGNSIKSTIPLNGIRKTFPDSINGLLNRFYNDGIKLIFGTNEFRSNPGTFKLGLNLTNNQINYIKINTHTSQDTVQQFNWFGYSYNHTSPKYRREVQNESGVIKQSGEMTGTNGNNSKDINLGESFSGTFHIYILSGSNKIAHDEIGVHTKNNSYITVSRENSDGSFSIIENNEIIPLRIVKLKIEGHLGNNVNAQYYTYEIEKGSQQFSGIFSNSNTFQDTFNFYETGDYTITVTMYNDDGIITKKELKINIKVPYDQHLLKINYPESSGLTATGTLDYISRSHDWNFTNCINDNFLDYGKYISGFIYKLVDGDGMQHLSGFKAINKPIDNDYGYSCRSTGYNINNPNPDLPNGRYTLTITTVDINGTGVGLSKSLTFDKGRVFTATFNTNLGSSIPKKVIGEGRKLSKPENPTRSGYTFIGRYSNSSLTSEYNFDSPVTQSFTLYAKREKNTIPEPPDPTITGYYTLTIYYRLQNGDQASPPVSINLTGGANYSITSPNITGYTPSRTVVSGIMPDSNKELEVTYTKNENPGPGNESTTTTSNTSDLYLKVSNKNPDIDERVKLTINVNEKYTGKILFPKLQYYNGSKRVNIYNTSSSYISDSSDELDDGQVQFRSSDEGSITISKFVKFSRSGKFRIYAEDKYGDDTYVQVNVADDDDNSSSSNSSNSSSDESNLTLSVNSASQTIYEPIDLTIKTDNYVGKINLYAKYKELTSNYRLTLNNTSTEYLSDYSNIWENGYYKMTSSDKGKKTFSKLVEFKKPGTYRLYAEDANGYANFVQIYVNEDNNTTSISSSNTKTNTGNSSENDEIEKLLRELLNKKGNNSSLSSSTNTSSPSTSSQNIERNKQNISSSNDEVYISRSCKEYRIQYNAGLGVFTSPDLKKTEYFINKEYFKRYIDSKNKQVEGCPTNVGWISTNYKDTSSSNEYYIAPNGKVYFFTRENGTYKSSGLTKDKQFQSLSEIKYYIRDRNPLIGMTNVK